jgi:hypothetical protein
MGAFVFGGYVVDSNEPASARKRFASLFMPA